jgi:hypothetical protein
MYDRQRDNGIFNKHKIMKNKTFLNILRFIVLVLCVGSAIIEYHTNNESAFAAWVVASLMTIHSFE